MLIFQIVLPAFRSNPLIDFVQANIIDVCPINNRTSCPFYFFRALLKTHFENLKRRFFFRRSNPKDSFGKDSFGESFGLAWERHPLGGLKSCLKISSLVIACLTKAYPEGPYRSNANPKGKQSQVYRRINGTSIWTIDRCFYKTRILTLDSH